MEGIVTGTVYLDNINKDNINKDNWVDYVRNILKDNINRVDSIGWVERSLPSKQVGYNSKEEMLYIVGEYDVIKYILDKTDYSTKIITKGSPSYAIDLRNSIRNIYWRHPLYYNIDRLDSKQKYAIDHLINISSPRSEYKPFTFIYNRYVCDSSIEWKNIIKKYLKEEDIIDCGYIGNIDHIIKYYITTNKNNKVVLDEILGYKYDKMYEGLIREEFSHCLYLNEEYYKIINKK